MSTFIKAGLWASKRLGFKGELNLDELIRNTITIPTLTSELTNDGSDNTSTYVETDELGPVAFSNDYNDLDNLPNTTQNQYIRQYFDTLGLPLSNTWFSFALPQNMIAGSSPSQSVGSLAIPLIGTTSTNSLYLKDIIQIDEIIFKHNSINFNTTLEFYIMVSDFSNNSLALNPQVICNASVALTTASRSPISLTITPHTDFNPSSMYFIYVRSTAGVVMQGVQIITKMH